MALGWRLEVAEAAHRFGVRSTAPLSPHHSRPDFENHVVFSRDGKWLMTTAAPCRVWAVGTWLEVPRKIGGEGLCFSPDGRLVAVKDETKVLRLVETQTGRTIARLESPNLCNVGCRDVHAGCDALVVSTPDEPAVHLWDLRTIRRRLVAVGV